MPYGPPPTPRGSRASRPDREPRAKAVRVTVDLTPAEYEALNHWLAGAGVELGQPTRRMTLARGIRAMIRTTAADHVVSDAVLDVMRAEEP